MPNEVRGLVCDGCPLLIFPVVVIQENDGSVLVRNDKSVEPLVTARGILRAANTPQILISPFKRQIGQPDHWNSQCSLYCTFDSHRLAINTSSAGVGPEPMCDLFYR
jgi:hypothetical protein